MKLDVHVALLLSLKLGPGFVLFVHDPGKF